MLVGEFNKGDTSIQITGLKPGNYYNLRILATNIANFTTLGPLIRLRTTALSSLHEGDTAAQAKGLGATEAAAVHATSTPFDPVLLPSPSKDFNSLQHQAKRAVSGRRNSPANSSGDHAIMQHAVLHTSEEDESQEAIQRLTERLCFLRTEKERIDRETTEDEEESKRHLADLMRERDRLRQDYREREEASSELRRTGNHLDKLNRTAQSKRAAKEKQLQQKKADRQKLKDDITKWEVETTQMKLDIANLTTETTAVVAAKDHGVSEIRKNIAEDVSMIKSLEEEIRSKGVQIKAMEKDQEKDIIKDVDGQGVATFERENNQAWDVRMQTMQAQLGTLWQTLQQTQLEQQQAEEVMAWWISKQARNPELFAPSPTPEITTSIPRSRSRRSRQTSSRTSTISYPPAGYQGASAAFHSTSISVPPFTAGSPLFNMSNGMMISSLAERTGLSQPDAETVAGTGPMSPAASDLLPSNLFRDEDISTHRFGEENRQLSSNTNGNTEIFLRHALTNSDVSAHGPHTPASASSRAGSRFSSPHESSQNLPGYASRPDPLIESEQHNPSSIEAPMDLSTAPDTSPLASSRLASLFSSTFNRQRGKPGPQEPPLLGTLKQGQSHSFPRNMEPEGMDLNGSRRRRGSHGTWANPMAGLLNRSTGPPGSTGLITARTGSGRKSRLNMFAPKVEDLELSLEQHPSSRPSSTYSFDQIFARPSTDSQRFGWTVPEGLPNRSSPLGGHWSGGPWSHAPSRRPSVKHDSTSNLSIGSTPLEQDGYLGSFSKQTWEQAPIGTRPRSSQRPTTPKLNPAAPSFKMFWNRGDAKKTTKADKAGVKSVEKARDKESEQGDCDDDVESNLDASPQNPRLSRDAQSVTTAASTADSHDSFDRSTSGTPSEAVTPSGPKETLMQKITRKSSSSKFNVPWSKDRGLFSKRAGEPSTPGEVDEDASSDNQISKSVDSSISAPQQEKASRSSISWPNIKRKSKRGDNNVNEAAERSNDLVDDDEN